MTKKVIDWKDANEFRPITSCEVVVLMTGGHMQTLHYSKKYEQFNCLDIFTREDVQTYSMTDDVKCWAYLHQFM